jgi:hypothetical protein
MMAVRRIMPLAIMTVVVVAACGQAAGSGTGGAARGTDLEARAGCHPPETAS